MTGEPTHTASEEKVPHALAINCHLKNEVFIILSFSAMFNPLHSITNQELCEKHLCNQISHYEKYRQFLL